MKTFWKMGCMGILLCLTVCLLLTSCAEERKQSGEPQAVSEAASAVPEAETAGEKAQAYLEEMSLKEKVYQMFMVRPEDLTGIGVAVQAGEMTRDALEQYPVGGIIYFSQNIEDREQLTGMIANTKEYAKTPLWIGVDEEGGRVARLGNAEADLGVATHPPMGEIGARGDAEEARAVGSALAEDLQALGFNLDFAPVADVLTVENNEDIGNRSFGRDPEVVSRMVSAVVEGLQEGGISATLKHFPSNGSTSANTHHGYGASDRTLEEMRAVEFLPFQAGIAAGADLVMVAHMAAEKVTGEQTPSTLSKVIITDLLREELGFDGVVVTDALNMGAIVESYSPGEAACKAVEAGADLLLMTPDLPGAAEALLQSVEEGEITEERIDESVRRILTLKYARGVMGDA